MTATVTATSGTRTAFITGASSGIGAAFARALARRGYNLVLQGRRTEQLEQLCATLRSANGINAEFVTAELSDAEQLIMLEKKIASIADLELLINNAGFGLLREFHREGIEEQEKMIRVHVTATVRLTHAALAGMLRKNHGSIINVSSVAAFMAAPRSAIYAATKAFLISYSESLHVELHGTGIRVQALCPGFTTTDFHPRLGLPTRKRMFLGFMSPERVVETSLRAITTGKVVCVPGALYKFAAALGRTIPRRLMYWMATMAKETSLTKQGATDDSP